MAGAAVLPFADHDPDLARLLDPEAARISLLLDVTARHREGRPANAERRREIEAAQARVVKSRASGLWAHILGAEVLPPGLSGDMAADVLAFSLFTVLRPSQAGRIAALQGGTEATLAQSLLHEALLLSPAEEIAMQRLLSPAGRLLAGGWLQIEGTGPTRLVRPGPRLLRRVLGEDGFGTLPSGVVLEDDGTGPLPALLLPPETARHLDEIAALARFSLARQLDEGAGAPGGPAVLMTGPPGTGKTLAARHLARRLNRPLFRLELGGIVSKWMGETERNLTSVFQQMSGTRGCILMDECDTILSRRVQVRESRDQTANMTVSHVLMLMERHRGPVFATSNLRSNIDDAFIRRFAAVIEFRRHDRALREVAWARALAGSVADDQTAPLARLAAGIDLSPAEIANAAHYARALAGAEGAVPGAVHLARAIRRERGKGAATFTRAELMALAPFLPPEDEP